MGSVESTICLFRLKNSLSLLIVSGLFHNRFDFAAIKALILTSYFWNNSLIYEKFGKN